MSRNPPSEFFMIDGALLALAELEEYRQKWEKAGEVTWLPKRTELTHKQRLLCVMWAKKLLIENQRCFGRTPSQQEFSKFQRDIENALVAALAGEL